MAEHKEFLEIFCKSSGKVRRFSAGTEAGFALQLINQRIGSGVPSALYIAAVKQGEEPIIFGPNSILVDYGAGWKLQTVTSQGVEPTLEQFPDVIEPVGDVAQSARDHDVHLSDPRPQEVNAIPVTSEPVSDIVSQSFEKVDITDIFTTDVVFSSCDELIKWTRDVGRTIGNIIVIKKSDFGILGEISSIFFSCERSGSECPFLLRGIKMPKDDQWMVKVECGHHNHSLRRQLQGSFVSGRLSSKEKDICDRTVKGWNHSEKDSQSVEGERCKY
ncbi:hypothetical protein IFM89_003460 [Coptis chinensis]|uniref:Uncharacterized protein n=1 Tax=Coptis chinensis TaxID=261450 RepID=A0A835LHG6_9MAGN|nr:hypothetical protein IFM89_003460 [Coptis chinensis]